MAQMDAPSKVSMKGIGGVLQTVVPEAGNDQTNSQPQVLGQFRTQALTVGPRLIGASPVWAARTPLGAAEATGKSVPTKSRRRA